MASFSYRGNRWQVRVRRKGHPTETRSFSIRQDAEKWARALEADMDRGVYAPVGEAQRITLGDLIKRYLIEVTPTLKGAKEDTIRLRAMMRHPMCKLVLTAVTPTKVAKFRDERLQQVSSGTVIRDLACLSSIINHARREWNINAENPVSRVRKPSAPTGRDRVLTSAEETRLLDALRPTGRRSPWLHPLVILALETAMRRGELLALRWEDVSLAKRTATLHDTKNGEGRVVPLSSRAAEVLQALPRSITGQVIRQEPEMLGQAERLVNTITPQWPGPHGTPLASLAIRAAGEKLLEVVNDGEDYTQRIVGAYLFGLLSITDHAARTTVRGVDKTDMVRQWTPFSMPLRVWASKNGIRELRVATTPSRPSSWLMGVRGYAVGQIAGPREIGFLNKHAPRG